MDYLHELHETLANTTGAETSSSSSSASSERLSKWNNDIESFLASNPICDRSGLSDSELDQKQEVEKIEINVSILLRNILSSIGTNDALNEDNCCSPDTADAISRSIADQFAESKEFRDINQLAENVRASKNLSRWFLQIFLDLRGRVSSSSPCPIRLLQSPGTIELFICLLKNVDFNTDDSLQELARNISLFLFYATYNPFAGDETSQKALSYLINELDFPKLTLTLLTRPCSAALALSLVRNIHNAIVSLQGAAKKIMEARFQFDVSETESAPWAPKENATIDFRSMLIDIIRWALESPPTFPGDEDDKRAELVIEILGAFYALRVGQGLIPSKCEPNVMELVTSTLKLSMKADPRIMQVKLSTISLLMDSDPSFGEYLLEKESIDPLLEILESQVTDVLEGTRVDNSAAASLVPTLAVLNRYAAVNLKFRRIVKEFIFPLEAENTFRAKVEEQISTTQSKNMGPLDAPKGSMRWKLISLLTWTQSHIKRCTGELLWTISSSNATEFVHRVGFGNALPILSAKGLAKMPTGA